jgi:hypothetical protein
MITDLFLNNMANAMTDNVFVTPGYLAVGTTVVASIDATDTSIAGEIGDRISVTKSVVGNTATYNVIRGAVDVLTVSTGDSITAAGFTATTSGNDLQAGTPIAGLTHTTTFDIEFIMDIEVNRV